MYSHNSSENCRNFADELQEDLRALKTAHSEICIKTQRVLGRHYLISNIRAGSLKRLSSLVVKGGITTDP